jgi:multidrug resistance protein MdtO
MATQASQLRFPPASRGVSWSWFRELVRWEIAPYPGRVNTVVRITITATLVMIIVVTFRIPNPFLAAFFSVLLARENFAATRRGGRMLVLGFGVATLYTLLGMMLFRGYPITHFFWVIGTFYLIFFVIRTATNYAAAAAFAVPIAVALPIWDRSLLSEAQVEGTLWLVLVIAVGAGVTIVTEAVYRIFDRSDPLIASVADLMLPVQEVAESIASLHAPPKAILDRVLQYETVGTGRLGLMLLREGLDPTNRAQHSALISLSGRLIDLAANLMRIPTPPDREEAIRLREIAERLGAIRRELRKSGVISASTSALEGQPSSNFPMLQEMEQTVALLTEVFQPGEIVSGSKNAASRDWWHTLFVPDAFQNPEYLRFAFAGCLSASVCFILYNALDWQGINTSVLTCIVTALSTIGTSLQAQFLRLAGFVVGGLVLGISAQILILPGIDTIFGFALFIAAATAIAAWFATSSPRLSYFGVQIAIAFYFVHLQDSQIQTDLTVARDKVIGVLLGILVMGFIFDRFGTKSDAEQLQKLLVQNIRLLAQLGLCPVGPDRAIAFSQFSRLRSQINDNFAGLTSQMDSVQFEFEFRHRRDEDVTEWERIQRAQPALRSIYLLEASLLSHRERREIDSELTQHQNQILDRFLNEYSDELMHIAAWIAHEEDAPEHIADDSIRLLQRALEDHGSPDSQAISDICQKMSSSLLMLRNQC